MAYVFPILTSDELAGGLARIFPELQMTKEDLIRPTANVVQYLYKTILEVLFGRNITNTQPTYIMPEYSSICNQEVNNLYILVRKFMELCHVDNFHYIDLVNPVSKRLICHLCGVYNYALYSLDCQCSYDSFVELKDKSVEDRANLQKQITENKTDLHNSNMSIITNQQALDQLRVDVEQLQYEGKVKALPMKTKAKEIDELKAERAGLKAKSNHINEKYTTYREEINKCSEALIKSPDKLSKEMDHLENELDLLKEHLERKRKDHFLLKNKTETKNLISQQLNQCIEKCNAMSEQLDQVDFMTKNNKEMLVRRTDVQNKVDEIWLENESKRSKQDFVFEVDTKNNLKIQIQLKQLKQEEEMLKKQLPTLTELVSEEDMKCKKESEIIEGERVERTRRHQKTMKNKEEQYFMLLAKVETYHTKLFDILNQADGFQCFAEEGGEE